MDMKRPIATEYQSYYGTALSAESVDGSILRKNALLSRLAVWEGA
jgi:hypothetical protein